MSVVSESDLRAIDAGRFARSVLRAALAQVIPALDAILAATSKLRSPRKWLFYTICVKVLVGLMRLLVRGDE